MRSSVVTTANQSDPCVKAVASASPGRATLSGRDGAPALRRMTRAAISTRKPAIITTVSAVTRRLSSRRLGGSWGSGASGDVSMGERLAFEIAADPPRRLDKALARDVPDATLSRSRLARLIVEGAVR